MWVANAVSLTFIAAFVIPGYLWYRGDMWQGRLLGGVVATNVAVAGLKEVFGSAGFFGRPAAASACDLLCRGGSVGGVPGFPSGHVATVATVVSAAWFHWGDLRILWIGIPWLLAMAWSRWAKSCHNWQQIVAGTVVGGVAGWLLA